MSNVLRLRRDRAEVRVEQLAEVRFAKHALCARRARVGSNACGCAAQRGTAVVIVRGHYTHAIQRRHGGGGVGELRGLGPAGDSISIRISGHHR